MEENKMQTGISRFTDLKDNGMIMSGWIVRETMNPETNRSNIELGIFIDKDVFLSVPVDYKMKYCFNLTRVDEATNTKYYSIPTTAKFGVKVVKSERTGKERVFLTKPDEEYPATFITCICHATNKMILDMQFEKVVYTDIKNSDNLTVDAKVERTPDTNVKVIRKYFDENRTVVGMILMSSEPNIQLTIREGFPTISDTVPVQKATDIHFLFTPSDSPVMESFEVTNEEGFKTEFIKFPMLVNNKPARKFDENGEKPQYKKFNKYPKDTNGERKPYTNNKPPRKNYDNANGNKFVKEKGHGSKDNRNWKKNSDNR